MRVELTPEEVTFLRNMLSGATVQGADAMRVLIAILDRLSPSQPSEYHQAENDKPEDRSEEKEILKHGL